MLTAVLLLRNGYTGETVLKQPWPENAQEDKRGAIRARRTRLQSGLLEKVVPGTIQFSKKLVALENLGENGALLRFEDGTEATADLVVGAEGIRSVSWHNTRGTQRAWLTIVRQVVRRTLYPDLQIHFTGIAFSSSWFSHRLMRSSI